VSGRPPGLGLHATLSELLSHFAHMSDDTLSGIAERNAPSGFVTPELAGSLLRARSALVGRRSLRPANADSRALAVRAPARILTRS
jgi:hypothetical protein